MGNTIETNADSLLKASKNGSFHLNSHYEVNHINNIIKYLNTLYETDFVCGNGYVYNDRILIITKDFAWESTHFAPAYHDVYIFTKDGQLINSRKHTIAIAGTAYSEFFVDEILSYDGEIAKLDIRNHLSGRYSKCSDEYHAMGTLNKDLKLHLNPFVFTKRQAEKNYPVYEDEFSTINGCKYKITNTNGLSNEEALKISETA